MSKKNQAPLAAASRPTHNVGGGVTADVLQKAAASPVEGMLNGVAAAANSTGRKPSFDISPALVSGSRSPLEKVADAETIDRRRQNLEKTFLASIRKGYDDPMGVIGGLSSQFAGPFANLFQSNPINQLAQQMTAWAKTIDKSFTLTTPLNSSFAPFDLVAPTLLIYPTFSPLRNRIPRPPGQGTSHRAKVITSVSGSQRALATPGNRMSIQELPGGGSLTATNWPNQLPGSGNQNAVDVNIPYKFFGLTEAVTWLSQFASQGFDDLAALASLILLQESMMMEELAIIGGSTTALGTPGEVVSQTQRSAITAGVAALSGYTTNVYVKLTAVNYYGETLPGTAFSYAPTASDVTDLVLPALPAGALAWNIYVGTGTTAPANSGFWLMASGVGAGLYTLYGPIPTSGTNPPTVDTGTGSAQDYFGIVPVLSGQAVADDSSGYPTGYQAGYYNAQVDTTLGIDPIGNALQEVYDGSSSTYFADPDEIWCEAHDAQNLFLSLAQNPGNVSYNLFVNQDQVNDINAGGAVRRFTNPVTSKVLPVTVHPYLPQGTVLGLSYKLPMTQTNVSNVWENVMVQDYITINWPVIDVTFRYSLFFYGTLFSPAPQYNFLLQGVQKSVPNSSGAGIYS